MRTKRFYGLKRPKLRQSWNKYNLYNLSRADVPNFIARTNFQQKWTSKALTRSYHGETIKEKHWQRMFRRNIRSVVPLDHAQLARSDGHEQAEGRGSGLDSHPDKKPRAFPRTPYMNMIYAPTERRLDTAIFRALFASSTRQARQFVIHGDVKVNGKRMIYPGYLLNPGDMFQVEPERVMFATGAPKDARERRATRKLRQKQSQGSESESMPESLPSTQTPSSSVAEDNDSPESATESSAPTQEPQETLKQLLAQAKSMLTDSSSAELTAKRKRDLRAFKQTIQRTLSRHNTLSDSIDAQLLELSHKLDLNASSLAGAKPGPSRPSRNASKPNMETALLRKALEEARDNPIDASKSYATPWRPRPYMSAFAFVPRYLEIHHRICSAVYLRHPVARPGVGEVPTPYPAEINGLAFNWYLRRR
ncbi:MAG: hypothetical protein Q9214_005692 [Letrouitia sp. 1 TL-2023]